MTEVSALERGRSAFKRRAWRAAHDELSSAASATPLGLDDLERLATAAYLIGSADDIKLMVRAHHEAVRLREVARASRLAFWIGFASLDRGEFAQGNGWLARATRLLDGQPESAEHGYVALPTAIDHVESGRFHEALTAFGEIEHIAERFADLDLITLCRLGRGQTLIRLADVPSGMALLDEAMVAVTTDEVSPTIVGIVYCSVIETCQRLFDLRRAQEWTDALTRWCESQPDLVPYRGQCLTYRAELMRLHGSWKEASVEAQRARDWLVRPPADPAAGAAAYQLGELHRLFGEYSLAAEQYRLAGEFGHHTEPGAALLSLGQGNVGAASAAIRRVLQEPADPLVRPLLLDACVEIMLVAGDRSTAEAASTELSAVAADLGAPLLAALAERARGAVLLASGDAEGALQALRSSFRRWQGVDAPYEAARTRCLIAMAYRDLSDRDAAEREFAAARETLTSLGARPDIAHLDALAGRATNVAGGLSARELEVLRLLATGLTNRAIADDLVISEKTVARHVANIFTKIGVSSRSAATAYAYEHGLLVPST